MSCGFGFHYLKRLEQNVIYTIEKSFLFLGITLEIRNKYHYHRAMGLKSRVFASGPGDRGSIPGRVIPKT